MLRLRDFIANGEERLLSEVVLSGYIVLRDNEITLLDSIIDDDWKQTPYILVDYPDLKYALMAQLALMGGGVSSLFHHSEIEGTVKFNEGRGLFLIKPNVIRARSATSDSWTKIDFGPEAIQKGKERFEKMESIKEEPGLTWPKYS